MVSSRSPGLSSDNPSRTSSTASPSEHRRHSHLGRDDVRRDSSSGIEKELELEGNGETTGAGLGSDECNYGNEDRVNGNDGDSFRAGRTSSPGVSSAPTSAATKPKPPPITGVWSQSEPSSLTALESTSSTTIGGSRQPYYSARVSPIETSNSNHHHHHHHHHNHQDEERYEGFGAADDGEQSPSNSGSDSPVGGSSNSQQLGAAHRGNPRSPGSGGLLARNAWARTSLGRNSVRKRLSSNALASQLYRSSSFNSSGRGSICDTADEVYSDVSLEDDVIDLNQRVQMIQEQMHALVDTQSAGEERYVRVKQENATLQARIIMLEEAAREAESRAEERLESEQRRNREFASRLEREKQLQLENYAIKLQAAEQENTRMQDEATRLREQLDRLKSDRQKLENALEESRHELESARDAERRANQRLIEANKRLESCEEELVTRVEDELKVQRLMAECTALKMRNQSLEESRDELQAALQAGREFLMPEGHDPNDNMVSRKNSPSLATELLLTGTGNDQTDAINGRSNLIDNCDNYTTIEEAKQALKEQREVNARLRSYLDGILLNIVENYPQLLEVKQPPPPQ